jgi:UDP-N-acetylmuramoyl-tripeptide--D-alanyl-D-alanine ligase
MNACAAAAVGLALDIEPAAIVSGLQHATAVGGRLREVRGPNGCRIFDDSYNANPASLRAAAEFLVASPGDNVIVLGDMYELGSDALSIHREIGRDLRKLGIDALYATGALSRAAVEGFGEGSHWFANHEALTDALRSALNPDSRVIVKGSRSMQMERVVDALTAESGEIA